MTVIEFPKHDHPGDGPGCLHCEILHFIVGHYRRQGRGDRVPILEAVQKCVEVLADLIQLGIDDREGQEVALRDVQQDLEHVLLQKIHFK